MKCSIKSLFIYLIIFTSSSANSVDLLETYQLAYENDPRFRVAEANFKAGLETKKIAFGQMLPQLSTYASYEYSDKDSQGLYPITLDNDENPITPEIRALRPVDNQSEEKVESWGLSLNQPIFNASLWFDFKSADYTTEEAIAQFSAEQLDLIYRACETYIEILRAEEQLVTTEALEEADKNAFEQAQKRSDVGTGTITEVFEAQSAWDASYALKLYDQEMVGAAYDALTLMTGAIQDDVVHFKNYEWKQNTVDIVDEEYPLLIEFALEHNFDIQAAKYRSLSAKSDYRSTASAHLPTISAEIRYDNNNSRTNEIDSGLPFIFDSQTTGPSASITASIPLFSGGTLSAQRRQSRYLYNSAEQEYLGVRAEVERQVTSSLRKGKFSASRVEARKTSLESSSRALAFIEKSFQIGKIDVRDVLYAQRAFFNMQRELINARYDDILNVLKLKQLTGRLSPQDVIDLNNLLKAEH